MKNQDNIDNYFDRVKQNPPLMDIEKVRQVIDEAEVKAKTETKAEVKKGHRNLLKFTMMTTLFAVIISAVLWWPSDNREIPNPKDQIPKKTIQKIESCSTIKKADVENSISVYGSSKEEVKESEIDKEISGNTNEENLLESIVEKRDSISNKVASVETHSKNPEFGSLQTIHKSKQEYVYPEQILDSTVFIDLNRKELENLGFKLKDGTIELKYLLCGGNFYTTYVDSRMSFGVSLCENTNSLQGENNAILLADQVNVSFQDQSTFQSSGGIVPMLITVENGRGCVKQNITENNLKALFSKRFTKDFKTLLPIIMRKKTFGDYPREDVVYWFIPTDEFFNRLPQKISKDLLAEYDYITAEDKSVLEKPKCKYFDECKNTLTVSNFKIYPNPISTNATVSFTLPEAIDGRITLVDLAGRERQVLQPQTSFAKGTHSIEVDLSTVPEGIYLLTLYSDKGVQTQRVIVAR